MSAVPIEITRPSDAEDRPHLSPSQLASFADCGERFRLERVDPVPAVSVPAWYFLGGGAVHETFEAITLDGLKGQPDKAEGLFRSALWRRIEEAKEIEPNTKLWRAGGRKSKTWPDKENGDWWLENGTWMVRKFATIYDSPFLPGRVVVTDGEPLVEVEFLIRIGNQDVKGFIDAIVELPDGELRPRDYKSGKEPKGLIQLATYGEAMRQRYGVAPTTGEYLMTRTMTTVTGNLGKLSGDVLGRLYDRLAAAKEHGVYLPNTSTYCGSCGVRDRCVYVNAADTESEEA